MFFQTLLPSSFCSDTTITRAYTLSRNCVWQENGSYYSSSYYYYYCYYSLLALQLCAGLGLLHAFITVNFSAVGPLAPRTNLNVHGQGLHIV
jgi:hypothetical protein